MYKIIRINYIMLYIYKSIIHGVSFIVIELSAYTTSV